MLGGFFMFVNIENMEKPKCAEIFWQMQKQFWLTTMIVTRIVVPKGQSVNAKYYSNIILPDVFSNWKVMTNKKTVKTLMLHHDNASSHKAKIVAEFLEENKVITHPTVQI